MIPGILQHSRQPAIIVPPDTDYSPPYRYWRIVLVPGTTFPNPHPVRAEHLQFRENVGVSVAHMGQGTSDARALGTWPNPEYAFASSSWYTYSATTTDWLGWDFGSPKVVREIYFRSADINARIVNFDVQASHDKITWEPIAQVRKQSGDPVTWDLSLSGAPALETIITFVGNLSGNIILDGPSKQLLLLVGSTTSAVVPTPTINGVPFNRIGHYAYNSATYDSGVAIYELKDFTDEAATVNVGGGGTLLSCLLRYNQYLNATPINLHAMYASGSSAITLNKNGVALGITAMYRSTATSVLAGFDEVRTITSGSAYISQAGSTVATADGQTINQTWTTSGTIRRATGIVLGLNV